MLKYFLFVFAVLILAVPSWAQVYEDKYEEMVDPLDRAVNQVNEMFADAPIPGADEDVKPQDQRYEEMTVPMNEANERHFDFGRKAQTIVEREAK